MKSNTQLETGNRIRHFRKRAGLSQLQLELQIDASFGSLSRMENGLTNPTKETLFAIAEALRLNAYETAFLFGINLGKSSDSITNSQFDSIYQV